MISKCYKEFSSVMIESEISDTHPDLLDKKLSQLLLRENSSSVLITIESAFIQKFKRFLVRRKNQ